MPDIIPGKGSGHGLPDVTTGSLFEVTVFSNLNDCFIGVNAVLLQSIVYVPHKPFLAENQLYLSVSQQDR